MRTPPIPLNSRPQGDVFIDRTRYMDSQKEKKKGFLTGDFHRRDEFANTVRTEQYREQLKSENNAAKAVMDELKVRRDGGSGRRPGTRDEGEGKGDQGPCVMAC